MGSMHGRGSNTSGSPLVRGGTDAAIEIRDFAFSPGNLEIPRGASVTWTNSDSAPHDATARGDAWRTERLSPRESDTIVLNVAGEYRYYCSIHPSMEATLRVR
jgi:plastocyanin